LNKCVEEIWEEFSRPLKNFVQKRVKNTQDAEDIFQDIFCKIAENIEQINEADKLHAWIYKIARNSIIDYYRTSNNGGCMGALKENSIGESQDETNANVEISQCLKEMIRFLPEKYKQAIILTEFHNMTQKEAAKELGLSESGAKSRVQRARIKLKEMLLACCSLEVDHFGNVIEYEHKCTDCKFC